jgi:aconitate hydratase
VERYCKEQHLFHTENSPDPHYSNILELDLRTVEPSVAGPRRPQDRVALAELPDSFHQLLPNLIPTGARREISEQDGAQWAIEGGQTPAVTVTAIPQKIQTEIEYDGNRFSLTDGSVVIAAITSCTNTSNPSVMIGAGIMAQRAVERGLNRKPWVKTSLAPGSKVVTEYLRESGYLSSLEAIGFNVVGYGCTTCIGNSGPLAEPISRAIIDHGLVTAAVLSGNRNFEARIHPLVRASYLASPMLVVAYALTGRIDHDIVNQPLGVGKDGEPVYLNDIWPTQKEINDVIAASLKPEMFQREYGTVFEGTEAWKALPIPEAEGGRFAWSDSSTYVAEPPFFLDLSDEPLPIQDIIGARVLAWLGDTVTTDHISPAGAIPKDSPAGEWLQAKGVRPVDFNTFGSRRGHHDVMMRGTFGNIRIKNHLVDGKEGNWTIHFPTGETTSIYDAAMRYKESNTPLIVLAGTEYGTGSSRDWAAKGTNLLGVRAVIAKSYERIHRSNLIGMGVLPLQFQESDSVESLGLNGQEAFSIAGIADGLKPGDNVHVTAARDGTTVEFEAVVRLDTGVEVDYYEHGGILQYVLRKLAGK